MGLSADQLREALDALAAREPAFAEALGRGHVLRAIEPEAPVVHSIHGRIDTSLLFPPDASAARRQAREPRPQAA